MITTKFLVTSLLVVLIPGTGVLYTVSVGLVRGRRASVIAALACTIGIIPHLASAMLGLAASLHGSTVALPLLRLAGAAYLIYLGYATWREKLVFSASHPPVAAAAGAIVTKALLLNILNPKLSIFFLAFLPQFVVPGASPPIPQLLGLGCVFMAMTFAAFVAYGLLAHGFRTAVIDSRRVQAWLRCGFSAAFAGLGLDLAWREC